MTTETIPAPIILLCFSSGILCLIAFFALLSDVVTEYQQISPKVPNYKEVSPCTPSSKGRRNGSIGYSHSRNIYQQKTISYRALGLYRRKVPLTQIVSIQNH